MQTQFRIAALALAVLLAGCECGTPPVDNDGGTGGGSASTGGGSTTGGGNASTGGGSGGGTGPDGGMRTDAGCGLVTCETAMANCGPIGDGCGGLIECGSCTLPETCGGGGEASRCGGNSGCVPTTCAEQGVECGPIANRCGGLLNCGSCALPEICGGAGVPGKCGLTGSNIDDAGMCIPTTCAIAGASCGSIGDGCGGTLNCGSCPSGQNCGAGGVPYQCGGGASCTALTCATADAGCGVVGDGCGGTLNCGACTAPQVCGGGGEVNKCGGGTTCTPVNPCPATGGCGSAGDGCGGTVQCGPTCADGGVNCACTGGAACGAGGVANQCGGQVICQPRNCSDLGANCGQQGDGCGGVITSCGTCSGGQTCGGGGVANQCGAPPACVPKTCAQAGANCGVVADGCGGVTANCGTCTGIDICGGAGTPNVCGSVRPDAGPCTALCQGTQACNGVDGGTSLSGIVYAPTQQDAGYGAPDPIPGALVYVPNGTVTSLDGDGGVSCDKCTDGVSGNPLVSTTADSNGRFTLTNVPCGLDVPVVIQLGKWRRQITVPSPACCTNTQLTPEQTRLPRKQGEGNPNDSIPKIAVVTGSADKIECVLPKIGIAMDQYSQSTGSGRVKFYRDNGAQFTGGSTTSASTLFNSLEEMRKYDMIILDCVGSEQVKTIAQRNNLEAYANAGGRVFASHFAYVWLYNKAKDPSGTVVTSPSAAFTTQFMNTAAFHVNQSYPSNQDAYIDTSFPKGVTFAEWVQLVNAQASTSTPAVPRIRVTEVRNDMDSITSLGQRWVYGYRTTNNTEIPLEYTFNTPVTAASDAQCGRVLFSDFHVINASSSGQTWPAHCPVGPMTPQEKVFEYLIFDLSSCIAPDVPPAQMCTPRSCAQQGLNCGMAGDGCGNAINCGTCTAPAVCGGTGTPNVCGNPCTPRTCASAGANCGTISNGCGGTLNCGICTGGGGQTCGGGGTPNVCGGGQCTPTTCAAQNYLCGTIGDGCGATLNCGSCPMGQTCGGGGVPGHCGAGMCTSKTCGELGFNCGTQSDGCGNSINCGTCTPPQICGGGGIPGVCGGGGVCTARTCLEQGFNCGMQGDGCGATIDCGPCPMGQICGGNGPGLCGAAMCTPLSCSAQGISCGPAGDGCGNIIQCGSCPAGQSCGGAGVPGQCGNLPCTPRTCSELGANCGLVGDGCGGSIDCGICGPQETCGGSGRPNVCGSVG